MAQICRVGDIGIGDCSCHDSTKKDKAGVIVSGSPNVFAEGPAVARVNDIIVSGCDHTSIIITGSPNVFVNGQAVARVGDSFASNCYVGTLQTGASKENVN
jgi:uncharacterized Zn-binding protein involved in type VI secretion